jgi:hypothetical protein
MLATFIVLLLMYLLPDVVAASSDCAGLFRGCS